VGTDTMPRAQCLLHDPALVWATVAGDSVTAAAYTVIPALVWWIVSRSKSARWRPLPDEFTTDAVLLAGFILFCGIGHWLEVVNMWSPVPNAIAINGLIRAVVSVAFAIGLWWRRRLYVILLDVVGRAVRDRLREMLREGVV